MNVNHWKRIKLYFVISRRKYNYIIISFSKFYFESATTRERSKQTIM